MSPTRRCTVGLVVLLVAAGGVACGGAQPGDPAPAGDVASTTTSSEASTQVDSPFHFDFSKPPVMTDPGTASVASTDDLRTTKLAFANPVILDGVQPTSIYTFRDGEGVQQSFDDPALGQFWFGETVADAGYIAGLHDACTTCDKAQSGRVKLSDGSEALVWINTTNDPSSISWYKDGVDFVIMASAKTLDSQAAAVKLAELVIRSSRPA